MSTHDARWIPMIIFAVAMAQSATARPLPVMNPGFEQPALADRAFTAVPDWVRYDPAESGMVDNGGNFGTYNPPLDAYPGDVPEGSNVGWLYNLITEEIGMRQTIDALVEPNTTYTLRVMVGDPIDYDSFGLSGFPGYRIELVAGEGGPNEMPLAVDDNSLSPEEGTFLESVLTYSSPASGPVVGQSLTIRLIGFPGPGLEVDFDDVRLDAVSADGPSVDLRIVAFEQLSPETFSITWLSEPGALYEIQGADTPDGMFVALRTDIEGAAGPQTTTTFTDPNAVEHAARFYVVARSAGPQAE